MSNFLILGGRGRLGQALFKYLCTTQHGANAVGREELDITDVFAVEKMISDKQPHVVVNCASLLSLQSETKHREAWKTNALGAANIAKACRLAPSRLVQISTDYVFDGMNGGGYSEDDPPNPINYYGFTKAVGEVMVQCLTRFALILRVPFRYDGPWPHSQAFSDQWISGRWMHEVVPEIVEAAISPFFGILHIGGPKRCVFDMAKEASPNVAPCIRSDFNLFKIPRDVSLDSSRWLKYREQHGPQ